MKRKSISSIPTDFDGTVAYRQPIEKLCAATFPWKRNRLTEEETNFLFSTPTWKLKKVPQTHTHTLTVKALRTNTKLEFNLMCLIKANAVVYSVPCLRDPRLVRTVLSVLR